MMQLILVAGAVFCALMSIVLFSVGNRISKANKAHYSQLREISGKSIIQAIGGKVTADREGMRDYYVAAGMAIDTKKKKVVNQGKLSSEAISAVIG